ncbi:MAG: NH(3)-dependent synthetase [Gemmatimonadetes bacterium]|nr:NH(3)-dependent synthetase [Gemmatimonadota bacterium]
MPPLVHVALAQLAPRKADYAGNLRRLGAVFAQVDQLQPRPTVLALAESALTGYFLEGGTRDNALTAGALARDLDATYRDAVTSPSTLDVTIGFYEIWNNKLYNSAMYVTLGSGEPEIHHVHRKVFLPTYGLFDEERFVERGREVRAFDTPWGRAAMLVCEDVWHSMTGTIAALDGAQVIFVCAAPPARGVAPKSDGVPGPASVSRWDRLIRDMADEHGVYVTLTNLVGSEGGKTFPGASLVAGPKGDVRGRAPLWDDAILAVSLDLADVTRARADMPLIADLETMIPHLRASIDDVMAGVPPTLDYDDATAEPRGGGIMPRDDASPQHGQLPVVHASASRETPASPLAIDPVLTEQWLVHFIRDEMTRRGFNCAVIGISGGVDSAVTAYLAAKALGPENVLGVRLPYRASSTESLDHAQLVIDALGIQSRTIDISAAVDGYLANEPDAEGGRRGNVMARMRMITLFDLAAKHRGVPLGTGNKTERLFGYFTWHADDSPPINPLGDLFKTQVWDLARHLGVPSVVVSKPPTADLIVGQTDESDFGISYAKADEILNWLLNGYSAHELCTRGFDEKEVAIVKKRVESTHWKRRLPTVAMLSSTAIGESYLRPVDY